MRIRLALRVARSSLLPPETGPKKSFVSLVMRVVHNSFNLWGWEHQDVGLPLTKLNDIFSVRKRTTLTVCEPSFFDSESPTGQTGLEFVGICLDLFGIL